jgi:hypothetical protein
MHFAIIQGVESGDGDSVHLFAVDNREHGLELFLKAAEFLPSESDAEALAGVLTPRVCVAIGPEIEVGAFDDWVRQVVQRLFGLIAHDQLAEFARELERFDACFAQSDRVSDDLVLALVVRATFPSPYEARYPCPMRHTEGDQGIWALWTVASPEEEQRTRPQVSRLLGVWLTRRLEMYG